MLEFWKEIKPKIQEEIVYGIKMKTYRERPRNLNDTLSNSAEKYPDKVAIVHGEDRLTYGELLILVNRAAYQLKNKYGVKKGDRVALLLMNGIPFVIGVYATLKIGAIAVPLNTKLKSQELEFMLMHSGAKVIISNREWWTNIEPILNQIAVEYIFITDSNPPKNTNPFQKLVKDKVNDQIQVEVTEHDPAFIMYTSGTTGRPKGALMTHFNMIHTALNYEYCYRLRSTDSTLIAVPVFHVTGLAAQLVTFIYLGGKVVLMPMFNTRDFLRLLESEKITHLVAAPTVYIMTLQELDYKEFDVSHVRTGGFGGAPMPGETLLELKSWIPTVELHNTYGLTETTSPAVIMPDKYQLDHISSVGVVVPVGEVKVVDPDTGKQLPRGTVGELVFKGPMVIQKYWNNEAATKDAIKDGWFRTGDLAVMDEKGFITIMDRIKDMINRGGEKIFSVEVEDVLYSNNKVMEAAIVGVPDDKYGEAVKACIVPRQGETLDEEEVKSWIRERLAKYKVPRYVEFMKELPRNPNGKVIKAELRYIPENAK